jgi:hypothetical protein
LDILSDSEYAHTLDNLEPLRKAQEEAEERTHDLVQSVEEEWNNIDFGIDSGNDILDAEQVQDELEKEAKKIQSTTLPEDLLKLPDNSFDKASVEKTQDELNKLLKFDESNFDINDVTATVIPEANEAGRQMGQSIFEGLKEESQTFAPSVGRQIGETISEYTEDGIMHEAHALGGYNGESPLSLSAAYSTFASGGYYTKPFTFTACLNALT